MCVLREGLCDRGQSRGVHRDESVGLSFLLEKLGLVRLYAGLSGIGQTFCGRGWDWSKLLQERVERLNLQWERVGLVNLSGGVGGICQDF